MLEQRGQAYIERGKKANENVAQNLVNTLQMWENKALAQLELSEAHQHAQTQIKMMSTEGEMDTLNHTRFRENDGVISIDWQKNMEKVKAFSRRTSEEIRLGKRMRLPCDLSFH